MQDPPAVPELALELGIERLGAAIGAPGRSAAAVALGRVVLPTFDKAQLRPCFVSRVPSEEQAALAWIGSVARSGQASVTVD